MAEKFIKYRQTRDVSWLKTPKDTIWIETGFENYIQPEDLSQVNTLMGVNLDLLDCSPDEDLFQIIN
jgi:hypothetical protein